MSVKVDESRLLKDVIALRACELDGGDDRVATVRESLESLIGPTVSRAVAARVLGVSQTALDRHIASGAFATVITPTGRREVPVSELVSVAVAQRDHAERVRSLSAVFADHRARAAKLTAERLLRGATSVGPHRAPQLSSLAYHRAVAEQLDERLVRDARRRLRRWERDDRVDPRWPARWHSLLELPLDELRDVMASDDDDAADLRQNSPFAGSLSEAERLRVNEIVRGAV